MYASKNWCDGERVKKLEILRQSKQGLGGIACLDSPVIITIRLYNQTLIQTWLYDGLL